MSTILGLRSHATVSQEDWKGLDRTQFYLSIYFSQASGQHCGTDHDAEDGHPNNSGDVHLSISGQIGARLWLLPHASCHIPGSTASMHRQMAGSPMA